MITTVNISPLDIEQKKKCVYKTQPKAAPVNYRYCVVNKPWGYEHLIFENSLVAVWVLHIQSGYRTSTHCHPNKKTSLVVISGHIITSTLNSNFQMQEGDGLIIDKGVFHSTKADDPYEAIIMEIESPSNKSDLVRLDDAYGREGKKYEGTKHISSEIENYDYFDFHEKNSCKTTEVSGNCEIRLYSQINMAFQNKRETVVAVLAGVVRDKLGNIVYKTGEIFSLFEFTKTVDLFEDNCLYLTLDYSKTLSS